MQQKRPKRCRFGRDLCIGVCIFACLVYACQVCMSDTCPFECQDVCPRYPLRGYDLGWDKLPLVEWGAFPKPFSSRNRTRGSFARCDGRRGRCPRPANFWKSSIKTLILCAPDALAEICPRSVPEPNQKIKRAFSGF